MACLWVSFYAERDAAARLKSWPEYHADLPNQAQVQLKGQGGNMLDLFYVAIGLLFFVLLWAFTKACERL
jgi:hypothetical protein